jgi:hypothetical protein
MIVHRVEAHAPIVQAKVNAVYQVKVVFPMLVVDVNLKNGNKCF